MTTRCPACGFVLVHPDLPAEHAILLDILRLYARAHDCAPPPDELKTLADIYGVTDLVDAYAALAERGLIPCQLHGRRHLTLISSDARP